MYFESNIFSLEAFPFLPTILMTININKIKKDLIIYYM